MWWTSCVAAAPDPVRRWHRVRRVAGVGCVGLVLVGQLSGCGLFQRRAPGMAGGVQEGTASWYGPGFHGKRTASGAIYNQHEMTAAHQTLPLGTPITVTNLRNGRQVEVVVTDRGPFVGDRILDLSYAAARAIDMVGTGTAPVRIEPASSRPLTRVLYAVQVGAFADNSLARRLKNQIDADFDDVHITAVEAGGNTYYRVRIGRFPERGHAVRVAREAASAGLLPIVVEDAGAY